MYYESIVHRLRPVASSEEAARLIYSGEVNAYDAVSWKGSDNKNYIAVSDTHIDDRAFGETALLLADNGVFFQMESITIAWIHSVEKVIKYFKQIETQDFKLGKHQLIIGAPTDEQKANFTCGCCGNWFNDFVKKQLTFDQDSGYGICPDCQKYH
jgi:hypothetical protein